MKINYRLYSGAGNTFLLIDNRDFSFPVHAASSFCAEKKCDGLLLLEESFVADFKMRLFNLDGSEAEMCGNGLRCFARFLKDIGIQLLCYRIETLSGIYEAYFEGGKVCTRFLSPKETRFHLKIESYEGHFLNIGVPHVVFFFDEIDKTNLASFGSLMRKHPAFSAQGTNVNIAAWNSKFLSIRTFERGVEKETLACGTGAVASALAASYLFALSSPLEVHVLSKDILTVRFDSEWNHITLTGPAQFIEKGTFSLNSPFCMIPR